MRKFVFATVSALALALAAMPVAVDAHESGGESAAMPETAMLLKQDGLAAGGDLEASAVRLKLPPGFKTDKHYHTGDVFLYVLSGAVSIETDAGTHTVSAGEAIYEIPGMTMIGSNLSADSSAEILVIQIGPKGEPTMVKMN